MWVTLHNWKSDRFDCTYDRLGYSRKGWTDCELAVLWLKHFDEYTRRKVDGCTRLLIVDGHNSHYSFEFLDYACDQQIHILCYSAHTTHIYQGLDVVIFSVLKWHWAEEKMRWEENSGEVTKETFLKIYGEVHIRTLTLELIQKVFEKTGVIPFNPDVTSPEMMAPSRETSLEAPLPLTPPTPVHTATTLLRSLLHSSSEVGQHSSLPEWQTHNDVMSLINHMIDQLKHPELEYLAHTSPIKASAQQPLVVTTAISPINTCFADLLPVDPQTNQEKVLIKALHDLRLTTKAFLLGCRAQLFCQAYIERVHGQLEVREKKNSREKGALGGGYAQLMTEDEVFNEIKSWKEAKAQ